MHWFFDMKKVLGRFSDNDERVNRMSGNCSLKSEGIVNCILLLVKKEKKDALGT